MNFRSLFILIQSLPIDIFHVHLTDASNIHYYFFQIVKDRQSITTSLTGSIANDKDSYHDRYKHFPLRIGGGRRDRTDDPLLAKQVLSQLSYAPSITNVRLR